VPNNFININTRVTHTISPKFNVAAVYNISQNHTTSIANFAPLTGTTSTRGQNVSLSLTQNWTTRLINSSAFNFTRSRSQVLDSFAYTSDVAASLGSPASPPARLTMASHRLAHGFTGLSDTVPTLHRNETFRFTDSVTWARPKHTIKIGGELRRMQVNTLSDPDRWAPSRYRLHDQPTRDESRDRSSGVHARTGSPLADFLLGFPQSTNERFGSPSIYLRNWGIVGYATDDCTGSLR